MPLHTCTLFCGTHMLRCPVVFTICRNTCRVVWFSGLGAMLSIPCIMTYPSVSIKRIEYRVTSPCAHPNMHACMWRRCSLLSPWLP